MWASWWSHVVVATMLLSAEADIFAETNVRKKVWFRVFSLSLSFPLSCHMRHSAEQLPGTWPRQKRCGPYLAHHVVSVVPCSKTSFSFSHGFG
jgi:hypothetical protein